MAGGGTSSGSPGPAGSERVFRLDYETPPEWVERVAEDPLALLADHAHCELKAAASAQALIARYPQHGALALAMAELAVEEMQHFVRVLGELQARGGALERTTPSPYAEALHSRSAAAGRTDVLLDRLIIAGLIEARSLERFHLLAEGLADEALAALYRELLPSEAAHRGLFFGFARKLFPRSRADERECELRALEGEIMAGLPFVVRVHSGMAAERAGDMAP